MIEESKQKVIKKIENLDREYFIKKANIEFMLFKKDKRKYREYLKELELWDVTLADGLD